MILDVEPTKVMEFSELFQLEADDGDGRDFDGERRLLREGRGLYECGRLWHTGRNGRIVHADVMDAACRRVQAQVLVRTDGKVINGMACSCTPGEAPRCAHACAVCFLLFFRHRFRPVGRKARAPHEVSEWVELYMARRLGTWMPSSGSDPERLASMTAGLEVITGFDRWEEWLTNDHRIGYMGSCVLSIEESIDMDTEEWPKLGERDLDAVLPHGWFTLLEAAYEQAGNIGQLAKLYAVYIAQGKLPQDARYVDRLRWLLPGEGVDSLERGLLGDGFPEDDEGRAHGRSLGADDVPITLGLLVGKLTHDYHPLTDEYGKATPNPAYEHLLRELGLSDKAVAYCETMRKADPHCAERLAETIAISHPDEVGASVHRRDDWKRRYDGDAVDELAGTFFPLYAREVASAYFANGYTDPIAGDCEDLIRAAGTADKARFRRIVDRRFADSDRATIARDLMGAVRQGMLGTASDDDDRPGILERAIDAIAPHADPLSRAFFLDDDVVILAPPIDEAILQRERPRDFMEALRLAGRIGDMPLTGDDDQDLAIVREALEERGERRKTEAHFRDIVSAGDDDYDPDDDQRLKGLRECLDVQVHALFGARHTLDTQDYNDLFDPAVTVGQRNKWLRPTVGQLGVWSAMYILRATSCKDLHQAAHLPHYLSEKGLKSAVIAMIDHMLGVTAMLGIPRAQVDSDEWHAMHLLRIDPHPEAMDEDGEAAILRPGRDFTLGYMTDLLKEFTPGLRPIDPGDEDAAWQLRERLWRRTVSRGAGIAWDDEDDPEGSEETDALALLLHLLADPESMAERLGGNHEVARLLAERAKATYQLFWSARDENDANPGGDPEREAGITDTTNMMLLMLEDAYTRLMDIAEPGYKDW